MLGAGGQGARLTATELRSRRTALGLTQAQLATKLGVAATTLARWERGERPISSPGSVRLALDTLATEATSARVAVVRSASA